MSLVDVEPYAVNSTEVQALKEIGRGGFSRIFLARFRQTAVVVKVFTHSADGISQDRGALLATLQREAGLQATVRHPNVVSLLAVCFDPPSIISEYCSRGSLLSVLRAARQSPQVAAEMNWVRRCNMMLGAAKGMLALHARDPPIVHQHITSTTLVVDRHWEVKVNSFTLSSVGVSGRESGLLTNPRYLAPEVLDGQPATTKSDVFSFAVILWEGLTFQYPFERVNDLSVIWQICEGQRLEIPPRNKLPLEDDRVFEGLDAYVALINSCWAQEPGQRPDFDEIIERLRGVLGLALQQERSKNVNNLLVSLALEAAREEGPPMPPPQQQGEQQQPAPARAEPDMSVLLLSYNELQHIRQIGGGGFGLVMLSKWRGMPVAVKVLLRTDVDLDSGVMPGDLADPLLANLRQEAAMMVAVRHENVVRCLGICTVPPCIVTEFCARGSLYDILKEARERPECGAKLDWGLRLHMMIGAAKGMAALHARSPPVLHRDVKSPNFLVDREYVVKVCDFNLSKLVEGSRAPISSRQIGTTLWAAPELFRGQPASKQSDAYSFGLVLWEMLTWERPFKDENEFRTMVLITSGERPAIPNPEELPGADTATFGGLSAYIALLKRCWAQEPTSRPSFEEIVKELSALAAAHREATQVVVRAAQSDCQPQPQPQQQAGGADDIGKQPHAVQTEEAGGTVDISKKPELLNPKEITPCNADERAPASSSSLESCLSCCGLHWCRKHVGSDA